MNNHRFGKLFYLTILCLFVASLTTSTFAQGRGRGGGGGRGSGNAGGPPSGVGVDRGLGNASSRSNGRSDDGLTTASERSNGRSDAGLERARLANNNRREAERELREHPGVARALKVTANDLRSGYEAALETNPGLKFGQYVAATRLEQNLSSRFPSVTRDAILDRLADGDSIGQALRDLGLGSDEAKAAKKQAERDIKSARN